MDELRSHFRGAEDGSVHQRMGFKANREYSRVTDLGMVVIGVAVLDQISGYLLRRESSNQEVCYERGKVTKRPSCLLLL